jgi:hypothetical protein
MIIWNREVNSLLTDLKQEKNLIEIYLRIFQKMLLNEVNKAYGYDVRIYRDKSCDQVKKRSSNQIIEYTSCYSDMNLVTDNYDSMLSLGLGNLKKSSILEDIYTFDFQANYFIEQYLINNLDSQLYSWIIYVMNILYFISMILNSRLVRLIK